MQITKCITHQKLHNQNEDIKVKQKCIEINRTAQKQLIEQDTRSN
jgi:hypothetical protein